MVFQNPHASAPLRYGLDVVCNVEEDEMLANVIANARACRTWVKTEPAHSRELVICGSGPSIRQCVGEIKARQLAGAEVWALNNCANFLAAEGVIADAQVIMDAQPDTVKAIGPARRHLFASQANPALFRAVPDAILWHATLGNVMVDEQDGFPSHDDDYCMIGSAVSVGTTALGLGYALGFRTFDVYGYDSSNGAVSHALHQPWNDGEPMTLRQFNGRDYVASLTMSLQANAFMKWGTALRAGGCTIRVHGSGLLPDMWNTPVEALSERDKYERMWAVDSYRDVAPGELAAARFMDLIGKGPVIDFGCGTGRGGLALSRAGLDVRLLDFASNCRDEACRHLPFIQHDLTQASPVSAPYGYCTDVLEHIPPADVDVVIRNIMASAQTVFFQISTVPDSMGATINQTLHLSVHPLGWWADTFIRLGFTVMWSEQDGSNAQFVIKRD